jgi:hypothetical protein
LGGPGTLLQKGSWPPEALLSGESRLQKGVDKEANLYYLISMMNKRVITIILVLGFGFTAIGLRAVTAGLRPGAQAEPKKTEKKEKEKDKKIKRVWTDDDLKEIKKEKVNITEISSDPGEKNEKKEAEGPPALVDNTTAREKYDPKKTEKYWRERKKALLDNIKANEEEIKNVEAELFRLRNRLNGTDLIAERIRLEQEINEAFIKQENYKKGVERMKAELEAFYEEARKEGILPAWLRDE